MTPSGEGMPVCSVRPSCRDSTRPRAVGLMGGMVVGRGRAVDMSLSVGAHAEKEMRRAVVIRDAGIDQ